MFMCITAVFAPTLLDRFPTALALTQSLSPLDLFLVERILCLSRRRSSRKPMKFCILISIEHGNEIGAILGY